MCEFKIGDLVEMKDDSRDIYYEITNISIDESVVFAIIYNIKTNIPWSTSIRLETSRLKHYKVKQERTSIYDKF